MGKLTEMKRKPSASTVAALEEMLELAKSGELQGVVLAGNKGSSSVYRVAGRYQSDALVYDLMSLVIDLAGAKMKNQWDIVTDGPDSPDPGA